MSEKFTDFLGRSLSQTPLTSSGDGDKSVFLLGKPLNDYILAIGNGSNIYVPRNPIKTLKNFNNYLKGAETSLSNAAFSLLPYMGVPFGMYGQRQIEFETYRKTGNPTAPDIAIHQRVHGITLKEFLLQKDALAIMTNWPQETFNHLMFQAHLATTRAHYIDATTENVIITNPRSEEPMITLFDLGFNQTGNAIKYNRPDNIMRLFLADVSGHLDDRRDLIEKLAQAAENKGFKPLNEVKSDDFALQNFVEIAGDLGDSFADNLRDRLNYIYSVLRINTKHEIPPEIGALSTVTLCLKTATVGEALKFLHQIDAASKVAHPMK